MFVDVLPKWERLTYGVMGIFGIVYSVYQFYLVSEERKSTIKRTYLTPGWSILGRDQDITSFLWKLWRDTFLLTHSLFATHVVISWLCFKFGLNTKNKKQVLLTCHLLTFYVLFGPVPLAKLIIETMTMYYISCTNNRVAVWVFGALKTILRVTRVWKKHVIIFDDQTIPTFRKLYFSLEPLCELRLVSFALDKIEFHKRETAPVRSPTETSITGTSSSDRLDTTKIQDYETYKQRSERNEHCTMDIFDCLFYTFYLPYFFMGPFYRFRDFNEQICKGFQSKIYDAPIFEIIKRIASALCWAVLLEFQSHYLYYLALSHKNGAIREIPFAALYGLWYCRSHFILIYHHLIWCIPSQVSRFDGVRPYDAPCCPSGLYNMTDTWRKFDAGLYVFMKSYVYVSLGAAKSLTLKSVSFVVTCLVTFLWHGITLRYVKWLMGSCLSLLMIYMGKVLDTCSIGIYLKSRMSAAMQLRVRVFLHTGPFLIHCFTIGFLFLFEQNVMASISELVLNAPWSSFITAYFLAMCHVHTAYYINAKNGVAGTPGLCTGDKAKKKATG